MCEILEQAKQIFDEKTQSFCLWDGEGEDWPVMCMRESSGMMEMFCLVLNVSYTYIQLAKIYWTLKICVLLYVNLSQKNTQNE